MKRFSEQQWGYATGAKIYEAKEMLRYKIKPESVEVQAITFNLKKNSEHLFPVTLTYTFSAPSKDVIAVKLSHFLGGDIKGAPYKTEREDLPLDVEDNENALTIINGKMRVVIQKKNEFGFDFYFDGKLLTGSHGGGSYITDINLDSDRMTTTRHREPNTHFYGRYLREMLDLGIGEYIYGLGERFGPLVRNGQTVEIWNRDNITVTDETYTNIPFYLSSKGYGIFVNDSRYLEFDIGHMDVEHVTFCIEAETFEYMVIGGPKPLDVLTKYTAMTGRSQVPPSWSFGLWLSSCWNVDVGNDLAKATITRMKEHDIPFSVFHFDADWMEPFTAVQFDKWLEPFYDPKELMDWIHKQGIRTCVWLNPYVSQLSDLFEEGKEKGYFLKTKDGKSVWQTDHWMPGMAVVDFTNPEASKWYAEQVATVIRLGVDAIVADFAEHIPTDVTYYDGSDPEAMHNVYPYLYIECLYNMLKKEKGEACLLERSGTVGSQKFPLPWGGDDHGAYTSMAQMLRGGLSLCQSGFSFWAQDISGFASRPTADLYKRWVAFGHLCTHGRLHASCSRRVPWEFDEESCDVLKYFTKQKNTLMPYLYSQSVEAAKFGHPVMRAMMLEFPNDRNCLCLDRQYMLGDSILVAPVFSEDGSVDFYVPEGGNWINYIDKESFAGGHWYERTYDYMNLPMLIKPGSVIAKGAIDSTTEYDYVDGITYELFGFENGMSKEIQVYNKEQNLVAKLAVNMNENILTINIDSENKNWTATIYGISKIDGISGGAAALKDDGLRIIPDGTGEPIKINII